MPLYEYRCQSCQKRFEVLQRIGEDATGLECPKCGEAKLEKLFSTFASTMSGSSDSAPAACERPGCGSGFT
jgi:putative FmdB family regulatory protein